MALPCRALSIRDQQVRLIPHRDFDSLLQAFFHDSHD
jgi:hypothetical protein